ncbi:ATP-binding protein [Streptomyces aidingensis]|uniref:Anti-sigma regulatory factor (Ser/Thr protein kinase) n=1 Tax=Streptomyces aidingensis TaxID=910347 RepID=A0A1I1HCB5_9ACTN|nr:ATP-binding protein [Streptomyces aidingensis]SFC21232.1 Anti-sigma regulatory factor (Ser/Thr protein kinase) [Streptomyces aidingensis]
MVTALSARMRRVPAHPVRTYRFTAPNASDTPRLARDHVAGLLRHTGHGSLAETARLLVSEAVTNVYLHTRVPLLTVRTSVRPDRVFIAVVDASPRTVPEERAMAAHDADDECGRGLALVAALATAWGITWHGAPDPHEKSVWFELRKTA